jgi:hypothetical protein
VCEREREREREREKERERDREMGVFKIRSCQLFAQDGSEL